MHTRLHQCMQLHICNLHTLHLCAKYSENAIVRQCENAQGKASVCFLLLRKNPQHFLSCCTFMLFVFCCLHSLFQNPIKWRPVCTHRSPCHHMSQILKYKNTNLSSSINWCAFGYFNDVCLLIHLILCGLFKQTVYDFWKINCSDFVSMSACRRFCCAEFVQSINPPLWCQQGSRPASAWHISYKWQLHHYSTG